MKKSVLVAMVMFAGSFAHAQSDSAKSRGALYTFKMILNQSAESTAELVQTVKYNAQSYGSLRFFQLREKNSIANDNCITLKSTLAANLLMVGTTIQVTQAELEQAPQFDGPVAQAKIDKLKIYAEAASAAIGSCKSPAKSLAEIQRANAAIQETAAFVNTVVSDL